MVAIQMAVLDLIKSCVAELKSGNPAVGLGVGQGVWFDYCYLPSWRWKRLPWRRVWGRLSTWWSGTNWIQFGTSWYGMGTQCCHGDHRSLHLSEFKDEAVGVRPQDTQDHPLVRQAQSVDWWCVSALQLSDPVRLGDLPALPGGSEVRGVAPQLGGGALCVCVCVWLQGGQGRQDQLDVPRLGQHCLCSQ